MVQIIIESMMEKLGNLESLGIVQSDPVDYQSFSMADAETDRNIAQRIAREELLERAGVEGEIEGEEVKNKKNKIHIQRYKGLGEMNADELWETTMDPEHRILKKVNIDDAQEADKVFDMLMGTDVPSRKMFIQSNAKKATIDI